jgi:putative colanic acid biosynthesis UDP-glucose lipid carrier transferase
MYRPETSRASHHARRPAASLLKRLVDMGVAAAVLLFMAPVMVLISLAILIESPGPVFSRQARLGLSGRTFICLRFRSSQLGVQPGDDPRMTAVGGLLRILGLDAMPQLLNVLKGDMSLVGPEAPARAQDLRWRRLLSDYDARFGARPGLTGLAQVNGHAGEARSESDVIARMKDDIRYVSEWSFQLDLRILVRSLPLLWRETYEY